MPSNLLWSQRPRLHYPHPGLLLLALLLPHVRTLLLPILLLVLRTSTETTNKPQPPTKTVESVRRKVVDVAMEAGPRVVSGVWLFYRKFDKPINKKGQNTQCQVKASPESEICGRLYKHQSGTGTAPLLDHLKHHHPEEYKSAIASSSKSKEAKAKKGDAYASAAGSCELLLCMFRC